jgi:hypothetical protein
MGGYIWAVSGQRFGKHIPAAADMKVTMVQQQNSAATNPELVSCLLMQHRIMK